MLIILIGDYLTDKSIVVLIYMNQLITVIVPVYNTHKYLEVCLNSLLNQTYNNLQIILIDDGSTDVSHDICDDYAARDNRVTVIHKENQGVSAARNLGIDMAKGDYISFIDSDDWLELDAYSQLVSCIREHSIDAILFEYYVDYNSGLSFHNHYSELCGIMDNQKAVETTISPINRFAWSKIYSRSIIGELRFENSIHIGEDTLFACEVLSNAATVYYLPKPLYHHVQSDVSATRCVFNAKKFTGIEAYHRILMMVLEKYPDITGVALSAYVSRLVSTIVDLCGNSEYPESHKIKRELNSKVRSYFSAVLYSNNIELRVKIRFVLCCINPWLPYLLHKRHRKLA